MLSIVTIKRVVTMLFFGLLIVGLNAVPVQAQSGEYGSELLGQVIIQLIEARASGLLDSIEDNEYESLLMSISQEYDSALSAESAADPVAEIESENNGAEVAMIPHNNPVCRMIGQEVATDEPIILCFYGHHIDATKFDKNGNEIMNVKIVAFEEMWIGGTYIPDPEDPYPGHGDYFYDGFFVGKFRKFFKYNDNADVFWKVEVGLNGSTLEFCSMRDQEYSDTARTKETCQSLYIDIY